MRRTFNLQMWPGLNAACEMPGDCGEVCHCGDAMEGHGMSDPPPTPTPMLCWACQLQEKAKELKAFGTIFPPAQLGDTNFPMEPSPFAKEAEDLKLLACPQCAKPNIETRASCRHCGSTLNPHLTFPERARSVPRAPDAWHACEAEGCRTAIPPERRLCVDHASAPDLASLAVTINTVSTKR